MEPNFSGRLSHDSSQPVMIPSSRSVRSRDKRQHLDTWNQPGLQENVLVIICLRMVHPEMIPNEFTLAHHKRTRISSSCCRVGDSFRRR